MDYSAMAAMCWIYMRFYLLALWYEIIAQLIITLYFWDIIINKLPIPYHNRHSALFLF